MASTTSSSSPPKIPPSSSSGRLTPSSTSARRPESPLLSQRLGPKTTVASSSSASPTAPSRTRSVRSPNGNPISARAAVKKPNMSVTSSEASSRPESTQLMGDLRERLQKAELSVGELKRHKESLSIRLEDASKEQAKQEEKMHEDEERIEDLENAKRELLKQKRELETIFEAERAAIIKDKETSAAREEELQNVIQRLKDSLSQKDFLKPGGNDDSNISRNSSFTASSSPTLDTNHFAPPTLQRSNSTRNNSKLLLQKDKLIEELRLELAELQIKLMEIENKGGGRMQNLEKALVEARVTNARLMEENESFQTLLMEKTLNGDFSQKGLSSSVDRRPSGLGASLADELSAVVEDDQEQNGERFRRLEVEVERQKAENKALTLYINKIIERILKHQGGFETILSHTDDEVTPTTSSAPTIPLNKDKDLPPPPPSRDSDTSEPQGFLQRAKSIAYGRTRPRPMTYIEPSSNHPSVTENLSTAPSIPLGRTQSKRQSLIMPRRGQTSSDYNSGAAAVVGSMFRAPDQDNISSPSPGIHSPRASYFGLMNRANSGSRLSPNATSEASEARPSSVDGSSDDAENSHKAALDALTGSSDAASERISSVDSPSPPRSLGNKDDNRQVLSGNKIRPLRLVKEDQMKNANRNSWIPNMGNVGNWFNATAPTSNPGGS